jgi:squalene synthase HpnC
MHNSIQPSNDLPDLAPGTHSLAESYAFCADFLKHYENFHLASFLFPRRLRPALSAVYAFARFSDDLVDEFGCDAVTVEHFEHWQKLLLDLPASAHLHPILHALNDAIARHELPRQAFADLLDAFKQDLHQHHYESDAQLLSYCARSANPVGRIVLSLYKGTGGVLKPEALRYSDALCTGLQLANFWQDLSEDLVQSRVYIPRERLLAHGLPTSAEALLQVPSDDFRVLHRELLLWAHDLLHQGLRLQSYIPRRHRLDIRLYALGGLAILKKSATPHLEILRSRPHLGKGTRLGIMLRALLPTGL